MTFSESSPILTFWLFLHIHRTAEDKVGLFKFCLQISHIELLALAWQTIYIPLNGHGLGSKTF